MGLLSISVIIPNYNGSILLKEILPFLFSALTRSGLENEIIVVDDCSTDSSINFIKQEFPWILLLENDVNKGFAPTANKGIFSAKYDHVLLLNSDVKLCEDYFLPLKKYFDKEDTFGVMGRITGWEDDIIQDGGKYPAYHGAKLKTSGNFVPLEKADGELFYSMYLSGANALMSREKFIELGGFNEIFAPYYVEDYELSMRAWRMGYKCYYEHDAVCRHKVSTSIKNKNSKNYINTVYYRNKMYLHSMHLGGGKKLLWYMQLVPETLIRMISFRFYYLQSLKLFFQSQHKLKSSIQKFEDAGKYRKLLSVEEVVIFIKQSFDGKKIRRF
ncbi:MAG: glycosyltransferase family 2 protein [Ferruginibacter sp.]